ncbi:MAG: hypothetical protein HYT21_02020 [Candidatus Nealsonbacteria bacterium]|nr:hypothetical protein [Candidatus Nealsonbacteria bacterium]
MPINITPEQYKELFNKLPKETQDLALSEKTAMSVFDSCIANDVDVDKISEVGRYADYVLVGAIKEDDLADALEREVGLEKESAKKIAEDIAADVFSKIGEKPTAAAVSMPSEDEIDEEMEEKPRRKDTYRETVE